MIIFVIFLIIKNINRPTLGERGFATDTALYVDCSILIENTIKNIN